MTVHDADTAPPPLEIDGERLAQLERALGVQDMDADRFGQGVRAACAATGFVFLFDLPTIGDGGVARVAAAATADRSGDPVFAFVALHSDRGRISVGADCPGLDHAEAVASAYLDLMVFS